MPERIKQTEEIRPDKTTIEALKGTISDPIETVSRKPGSEGKMVQVRIALEGPGLYGLTDWRDNKEWAGITNHVLLSARYAVYFAQKMADSGHETNPQRILNGMIVSHPGRRQWDEARWYPDIAPHSTEKQTVSNEKLGLRLIHGKVPQDAFELVAALADDTEAFSVDPNILKSWDYKIANYTDHRTAQKYEPLNTRMGDFLLGNFYARDQITPDLKEMVYKTVKEIIEKRKAAGVEGLTLEDADAIADGIGVKENSSRLRRKDLLRLILQDADTEAALIQSGIDPNNINDETVPMSDWEDEFRKNYVLCAQESIVRHFWDVGSAYQQHSITDGIIDEVLIDNLRKAFSSNTWWGRYARQIFSDWYAQNVDSWDPFAPR